MAYEIIFTDKTSDETVSPISPSSPDKKEKVKKADDGISKDDLFVWTAYKRYVSPFVKQGLQHQISTVQLRTGSVERQEQISFAYSVGEHTANAVENVVLGAMTGGGVGAIIGLVMSALTTMTGYMQKIDTLNMQSNLEQSSIGLMNVRAGGTVATTSNRR